MWTYIEKVRDQASAAPAVPTTPATEAKDDINRPLKPRNLNLYYSYLHMECYYFCQQCKDHFEVASLLGHKCISFITAFLKDHILKRWQQYKTRMQRNRLAFMTWDKFEAFLKKSQGESNVFVDQV